MILSFSSRAELPTSGCRSSGCTLESRADGFFSEEPSHSATMQNQVIRTRDWILGSMHNRVVYTMNLCSAKSVSCQYTEPGHSHKGLNPSASVCIQNQVIRARSDPWLTVGFTPMPPNTTCSHADKRKNIRSQGAFVTRPNAVIISPSLSPSPPP
jgi:hypothetical protein